MANIKVSLVYYCKVDDQWKRFNIKRSKNGRPVSGEIVVDGKRRVVPGGKYQLRGMDGNRLTYRTVGTDVHDALAQLDEETQVRSIKKQAEGTRAEVVVSKEQRPLRELRVEFLADKKLSTSKNCMSGYRTMFDGFFKVCSKRFAHQIEKRDVLVYIDFLRNEGYADHTVFNRYRRVTSFLKWAGVKEEQLPDKRDKKPTRPKHEPESYTLEEATKLIASCENPRNALTFELMLKTGLREREVAYLEWWNIDFAQRVVTVRNKEALGFRIKDNDERAVPLEAELLENLREWQKTHGERRFVFGTANDQPEGHFLRALKLAVRDAGLNCGVCETCARSKQCERWWLHKFRATFATLCLQRGMDVKTLMKLLGHEEMEVTLRYLSAAKTSAVQNKIDNIFAAPQIVEMPQQQRRRAS